MTRTGVTKLKTCHTCDLLCQQCDTFFKNGVTLQNVVISTFIDTFLYICDTCDMFFSKKVKSKYKSLLNQHSYIFILYFAKKRVTHVTRVTGHELEEKIEKERCL